MSNNENYFTIRKSKYYFEKPEDYDRFVISYSGRFINISKIYENYKYKIRNHKIAWRKGILKFLKLKYKNEIYLHSFAE